MGEVFEIHQKRVFTLDEARRLLPIIRRVTSATSQDVQRAVTQLNVVKSSERRAEIELEIRAQIQAWYEKIRKLGCESKGLWLVDFDTGDGYYCWHHPESDIEYFHGYSEGFQGRVKLH